MLILRSSTKHTSSKCLNRRMASRTVGSVRQKPAKSFAGFLPIVRLKWPLALANTRARIMRARAIAVCRVVPHKHSTTAAARNTRFSKL